MSLSRLTYPGRIDLCLDRSVFAYFLLIRIYMYTQNVYTVVHRSNFIYNNTIARSMCAIIFFARSFEYIPFSLALSFKLLSPSSSLFQSGQNLSSSACTSFSFPFWRFLSKYNFTCSRSLCPCKNTYVFQR